VPRAFLSPFIDSSLIDAPVGFLLRSAVNPPPWIMNVGMMRWNVEQWLERDRV